MHRKNLEPWQHSHTFGLDKVRAGERKTVIVTGLTAVMMVAEIIAGIVFGSMALLADGLHMASHATALCINAFAYVYARRHASDRTFTFGTGKVNTLGGFTGAVLLSFFALFMAWESFKRLVSPVPILFDQAIFVAVLGLIVNGISVFVLDIKHVHSHEEEDLAHPPPHERRAHTHDHNLRSAYLHVLADAMTSVFAIFALLVAKYYGMIWVDPLTGVLGAILVTRWSLGLIRDTSFILLDKEGPEDLGKKIREIEQDGDTRVADLHIWSIGPHLYSAVVSVVANHPREPEEYKKIITSRLGLELAHITVEVCKSQPAPETILRGK